jgi:hypothetical protein
MSIAAPASFTITGGATITINVSGGSNMNTATLSINSHNYTAQAFFDNPETILADLAVAISPAVSGQVVDKLFTVLQGLMETYLLAANQSGNVPFNIAIA